MIGHADWHADNVRWSGDKLLVVHDWDSVVYQAEAVVSGLAAAIFPASGASWQPATITESEDFLNAYLRARSAPWSRDDIEAFWAATVWTRAFDAKKSRLTDRSPALVRPKHWPGWLSLAHDRDQEITAAITGKHADELIFSMPGGSVVRLSGGRR